MRKPKLLLIGIDAADSQLVRTWASEGYLPTIAKLMRSGVTAPIATPLAVLEGGIWPTLLTSSSPATHGMLSYLELKSGTYDLERGMYADRLPVPPFWAHLSRAGKRVAAIDVPFARPVQRLNGIQVTNWGAHDRWSWKRSSWPPRLITDLVERFGDHPVAVCDAEKRTFRDYEDLRARLLSGVQKKTALLRHCLEMEDWDFFFGVFSESHCAGHQFWHLMDPRHPRHDPRTPLRLRTAIRDVYGAIDAGVARLLEGIHPETHVLLMLSHGMGPYYAGSHLLDSVLERMAINGRNGGASGSKSGGADTQSPPWKRILWSVRHLIPKRLRQTLKARLPNPFLALYRWTCPDPKPWPWMRAFAIPSHNMTGAIRINLKGREPAGMVEPGTEYETLCQELTDGLLALENADTGRRAVQWVARAGKLYQGPRLSELPDLFVEWDHSAPVTTLRSPQIGTVSRIFREERTGDHRGNGLLVGLGPQFRSGAMKDGLRTQDIGPTVLDFFAVPSPAENEGTTVLPLRRQA